MYSKQSLIPIYVWAILALHDPCVAQTKSAVSAKVERHVIGNVVREPGPDVRGIFQDSKGNIWFATNGQGVYKYDGKTIVQFTTSEGLCCDYVWNVHEDKDGAIWFTTRDGICNYNGREFVKQAVEETPGAKPSTDYTHGEVLGAHYRDGTSVVKIFLPHTSPLRNEHNNARFHYDIYSTLKDRHGNLWFGTCTAGVCKYDGKTYTWLGDEELGAPVRAIFVDRKGTIWIGNNGYGLLRYDGKTLTNITKQHKLENPDFLKSLKSKDGTLARVWTITEDNDGRIWVGTIDAGAWMLDGVHLTHYATNNGLGSNMIWSIYKDKTGKLWFGTDGAGVYQFDGKRFSKFRL